MFNRLPKINAPIIRKSRIAPIIRRECERVATETRRECATIAADELSQVERRHVVELSAKQAEIERLNNRIDGLLRERSDVENKRGEAREMILSARSVLNRVYQDIGDKYDALRQIRGTLERAQNDLGRIGE